MPVKKQVFPLGNVVATAGANKAFTQVGWDQAYAALQRHSAGDWGDLDDEDRQTNDMALETCNRLFSAYRLSDGTKFWIVTEADRSTTTFLLPGEY